MVRSADLAGTFCGDKDAPKAVVLHDLDLQLTTYFQIRSKYALPINLKDLRRTMPL